MLQIILPLFILAIPIACVAWTVTHEEIFREIREYCERRSKHDRSLLSRKFFYMWTCEYCFSHYVTIFFLAITQYTIFFSDWRGYLVSFFSLVFVANVYMNLYAKIRVDIKMEKKEIEKIEEEIKTAGK